MYVKVKVFTSQKEDKITQIGENRYEIRTKAEAKNNMANKRVLEILASRLDISVEKFKIINGHHHPIKLILVVI